MPQISNKKAQPRSRSVSFFTLGCRLNQSETAVLQNSFEQHGYRIREFGKPTDIVVINTCTVTENSDNDTRKLVNRIVRLNPKAHIALVGCQAQLQHEELSRMPNVRWVIGTAKKMDLAAILSVPDDHSEPQILVPTIPREYISSPVAGIDRQHTRANIKIQDGCDAFCSFCEIPYARGRARSRALKDILTEAAALVAAGHKELVLTGVNIGKYLDQKNTLGNVIQSLEKIPGLIRIRISSIEPTAMSQEILDVMAGSKKLCRHLHVPIQSASPQILKLMHRPCRHNATADFIQQAATRIPEICLGTDVIVGFPGETDHHFAETFEYLKTAPIHYFHVFSYSQRRSAKSQNLPQKVPVSVIQKRSQILRHLSTQKRQAFYESMLDKTVSVLFEQKKGRDWSGLTDNFLHVRVASTRNLTNQMHPVRLEKVSGQEIMGRLAR